MTVAAGAKRSSTGSKVDSLTNSPTWGFQKRTVAYRVAEDRRRMTDLASGRSADPFEELAGPVDDVHGGESRVALSGAALVRGPAIRDACGGAGHAGFTNGGSIF